MMIHSLLYVSKSRLPTPSANAVVQQIASQSVAANSRISITGALIFTGSHFAQIIEGASHDVDKLIAIVRRDSRHEEVQIFERIDRNERRFPDWNMAYMGPSQFVSRHVMKLLDQPDGLREARAVKWMGDLMAEFAMTSR